MKKNIFQSFNKVLKFSILVVAGTGLLLTGCASPKAKFSQALSKEHYLDANDTTTVEVESNNGVVIETHEKERIAQIITNKVNEQKILNVDSADSR